MDQSLARPRQGFIEVICGCMYSGKTEELIRQLKRCEIAKQNYRVFKPTIDDRYSEFAITSHNQESMDAVVIDDVFEIYEHITHETQVVGIDEAQFFADEVVDIARKLADNGRRVIVAGLDTDWRGRPFGPMPQLLATADLIRKQYAICTSCGESATRTQRVVRNEEDILVGSFKMYEARCRRHFDPELKDLKNSSVDHLSLV